MSYGTDPQRMADLRSKASVLAGELGAVLGELRQAAVNQESREAADDAAAWLEMLQRCLADVE